MKTLGISVIAMVAFVALVPMTALADTWGEPINTPDRFIVLDSFNGQAVFDKETGLIWEKIPETLKRDWLATQDHCDQTVVGNRRGWRLPTIQELASLVDPMKRDPALPAGHPFNVRSSAYWSATTVGGRTDHARVVFFDDGGVSPGFTKDFELFGWCVRGGQGVDPQ